MGIHYLTHMVFRPQNTSVEFTLFFTSQTKMKCFCPQYKSKVDVFILDIWQLILTVEFYGAIYVTVYLPDW